MERLAISPSIKKMKAIVYHKYGTPDVLEFTPTKPIFRAFVGVKRNI
jgi:hypothetical protein